VADDSWDVVIIGAGAAGLAAARELRSDGHSVLLLEARDRLGGRLWTRREPGLTAPVELGAEFIHGQVPQTFELLAEAQAAALDTSGERWTLHDGRLEQRTEDLFGEIQAALDRASVLAEPDVSFDTFLNRSEREGLSKEAATQARAFVEGFDAADPARVSTHFVAREWGSGGMLDAPQFRPEGGYETVLSTLQRSLERTNIQIRLRTAVRGVRWQPGSVHLDVRSPHGSATIRAHRAVVTLPLAVLQLPANSPDAVQFEPDLAAKRQALQCLATGAVLKVNLRFRTAFWEALEQGRYRQAAFFHSPGAPFRTFWTPRPLHAPLLTAWMGGPRAEQLSACSDKQIVNQALSSLAEMFGQHPEDLGLQAAWLHNWQTDPFAHGAYSYVAVGGVAARHTLAAPLEGTIFFAGEATNTENEAATVAGALQSGARAAREVRASLIASPV